MNVKKTVTTREVEKVITETVEEPVFVIELNYEEACALQALIGHTGGWRSTDNLRVVTDDLYHQFTEQGIDSFGDDVAKYSNNLETRAYIKGDR